MIKRHFYLKKEKILKDVKEWLQRSETVSAMYAGLILDHNNNWCTKFKQKGAYTKMLQEAFDTLKKELDALEMPQ